MLPLVRDGWQPTRRRLTPQRRAGLIRCGYPSFI
jgi:hypothetical protein